MGRCQRRVWIAFVVLLPVLAASAAAEDERADPLEEGISLLGGERHDEGVRMLRAIIEREAEKKRDPRAMQARGRAHLYLGEDEEAIAAFEQAIERQPRNAEHHYWLGIAVRGADAARARRVFEKAVALHAQHGPAWTALGRVLSELGEDEAAIDALVRGATLTPEDAESQFHAGVALQSSDRSEEAVPYLERAVARMPEFSNASFNLGLIHFLAGRSEKARDVWVAAAEHAPGDFRLHSKIVQAFHALEQYEEASAWRDRVLAIRNDSEDEAVRSATQFCFDQFEMEGVRIFAFERFDRTGPLVRIYVFYVVRDGKEKERIALEKNSLAEEMGGPPYVLGMNDGDEHVTYDKVWREIPPYPELKAAVRKVLRGEMPVAARSRRSSRGSVIELGR